MPNYLSVEKEQGKAALKTGIVEKKAPSAEQVKRSLKASEDKLKQLAAEERMRREAGGSKADLAVRLASLPAGELPPEAKPAPPKPMSETGRSEPAGRHAAAEPARDVAAADKQFRQLCSQQPVEYLIRMCSDMGLPSQGKRMALIDRLANHAKEQHERMQTAKRSQQQQPPSTAASAASIGTASRARPGTGQSVASVGGLSVASLSLAGAAAVHDYTVNEPLPLEPSEAGRPGTGQSVQSFVPTSGFAGPRPGQVFKKDARGLGYYRDGK